MTLKLEVGKTYLNKSGQRVRIICVNGKTEMFGDSSMPVIGLSESSNGNERVETYTASGAYLGNEFKFHKDLVSEFREPDYRWFNVYRDYDLGMYHSSLANAKCGILTNKHHIGTYRIDLNTGDIMKEEG